MSKPKDLGEEGATDLSQTERQFIVEVAHANLNHTLDNDTLKHFADAWWNLCSWESQRASGLDSKAQGMLGLSSIAGAVVTVSAPMAGSFAWPIGLRVAAIAGFVVTALFAILALRVRDHGGFFDQGVFEALAYPDNVVPWFPAYVDDDRFRRYLREMAIQRWLVYRRHKDASRDKVLWVERAQIAAFVSGLLLALSVVLQAIGPPKAASVTVGRSDSGASAPALAPVGAAPIAAPGAAKP
jgi:hypothetical protein